ncbi:toll/interleukin-1 receptor domain-containing protein [Oleiharenicola lentus]|uniref:toll/interleukin-1 receptor domain-containing protein n=1 Tax=Oleiharenicola lentus TaxID=2508720 RepID=UPI003F66DEB9
MPKLFISHATADRAIVNPLRIALGHFGDQVFIAPEGIAPGESGWRTILTAISESELFILVATPAACASESVKREINEALRLGKRIVPLRWGMAHNQLPLSVQTADYQSFDLQSANERARLFDHVGLLTGKSRFWKGVLAAVVVIAILYLLFRE